MRGGWPKGLPNPEKGGRVLSVGMLADIAGLHYEMWVRSGRVKPRMSKVSRVPFVPKGCVLFKEAA